MRDPIVLDGPDPYVKYGSWEKVHQKFYEGKLSEAEARFVSPTSYSAFLLEKLCFKLGCE